MKDFIDIKIKKALFDILREQDDSNEKKDEEKSEDKKDDKKKDRSRSRGVISTTGAFGSGGRAKRFVTSAKARATEDPKGLMRDLGITSAASGNDIDATLNILRRAILSNPVMSEAYAGARLSVDRVATDKESRDLDVISIKMKDLDRKNGIRFLAHTLTAAQNAGYLNLQGNLQFAVGLNNPIIIYSF